MTTTQTSIIRRLPEGAKFLPQVDNVWHKRMGFPSSSTDNLWVVSQNVKNGHWGCNCPGWKRHRKCKHLAAASLPNFEQPFMVEFK